MRFQGRQTDELTFGTRLTFEQKENIKLLSAKFVNKYIKADKRNYSALSWNPRIITIRENKFLFYKMKGNFDFNSSRRRQENNRNAQDPSQMEHDQIDDEYEDEEQKMEILPESLMSQNLLILKGEINITDITRVQWPSDEQYDDPKQKLILYFPKNRMILYDDDKVSVRNEKEKGEAYWMFEIGNFMKDDHKDRIEREKRIEEEKKKRERKKQEEEERKKKEKDDQNKSSQEQEEALKKKNQEAQVLFEHQQRKHQEAEILMKERQNKLQEEQERQNVQLKAEQEKMKLDEKLLEGFKKKIENSFEFYYFLLWEDQEDLFKQSELQGNETEEQMKERVEHLTQELNLKLYELIGQKATRSFKELVQEMVLPSKIQKIKKIEERNHSPYYWLKEEGEDLYIHNEIIFRVTRVVKVQDKDGNSKLNDTSMKCISNEFRANRILSDILFTLRKESDCHIQVPLSCLVEYLGFKAMCIAVPQIESDFTLAHGPCYGNDTKPTTNNGPINAQQKSSLQVIYRSDDKINAELERISQVMNLKSFYFKSKEKDSDNNKRDYSNRKDTYQDIKVHLSMFNEIHTIQEHKWNEIVRALSRAQTKPNSDDASSVRQDTTFDSIKKLIAQALVDEKESGRNSDKITEITIDLNWFSLVQKIVSNHTKEGEKGKNMRQKSPNANRFYYIIKNSNLFPVQFYLSSRQKTFDFSKQFRPEFLFNFASSPMSNGSFINPSTVREISDDDILSAEYSKSITEIVLPSLIEKLEKLQILIYDSVSVSKAFHKFGVNLRYMGLATNMTNFPHIRDILVIEMIARSIKKIYRYQMTNFIWEQKQEQQRNFEEQQLATKKQQGKDVGSLNDSPDNRDDPIDAEGSEFYYADFSKDPMIKEFHRQIRANTFDFLNLVFGYNKNEKIPQQAPAPSNVKGGRQNQGQNSIQSLLFVKSNETKVFWQQHIIPQVKEDFDFDLGTFPVQIPHGGLLNAVLYHLRINMGFDFKSLALFASNDPFEDQKNKIDLICHSKFYDFPTQPLRAFSQKWKVYKQNEDFNLTYKALQLDLKIEESLQDRQNPVHITSDELHIYLELMENSFKIGENSLKQKQQNLDHEHIYMFFDQAIKYGEAAFELAMNGTMGLAKYYILLMKICYNKIILNEKKRRRLQREITKTAEKYKVREADLTNDIEKIIQLLEVGDENQVFSAKIIRQNKTSLEKIKVDNQKLNPDSVRCFEKAQEVVEFNLGEYHFLFASLYCQSKEVHKSKDEEILRLLLSALTCCSRILGNNHIQTAEVCKDISEYYNKFDDSKKAESLHFYEKALHIQEAEYGPNSFKVGQMCYQLGERYQKLGNYQKVLNYSMRSFNIFAKDEVTYYLTCIQSSLQICKACSVLKLDEQNMIFLEKIWEILEKYSLIERKQHRETVTYVIQNITKLLFCKLSYSKRIYMYKIMLAFKQMDEEVNNKQQAERRKQLQVNQSYGLKTQNAPIKKDTIIKKPISILGLDELEKNRIRIDEFLQADNFIIKSGDTIFPEYKTKFIETEQNQYGQNGQPQKRAPSTKKVNYDLQEAQKEDSFITFRQGLIKCRAYKTVSVAISSMLLCFMGQYNFINFRKNFFNNFSANILSIINSEEKFENEISQIRLTKDYQKKIDPESNESLWFSSLKQPTIIVDQTTGVAKLADSITDLTATSSSQTEKLQDIQFKDALIFYDELIILFGEDFFNDIINKTYDVGEFDDD